MRAPGIVGLMAGMIIFSSCAQLQFPHRAYVSPYHEPLLIDQKGGAQFSAGISPFKYLYAAAGYSPIDHFVAQGHVGGTFGLINANATLSYYGKVRQTDWFLGATMGFQDNVISRETYDVIGTYAKLYAYSCGFKSGGLAAGMSVGKGPRLHIGLRVLYNVVDRYNYYFEASDRYTPTIAEHLSYDVPDFIGFHPNIALTFKSKEKPRSHLKLQVEGNLLQTTLIHRYQATGTTWYGYQYNFTKNYFHPVSARFSLTIAYIFYNKGN